MRTSRRDFLKQLGFGAAGLGLAPFKPGALFGSAPPPELFFKISLAEWSFAGDFFRGQLANVDFPAKAKNEFGIEAVEYVNTFMRDHGTDTAYFEDLRKRTDDLGVRNVLIMVDAEGALDAADAETRTVAVENHTKWIEAARILGCHSIRVNLSRSMSDLEADVDTLLEAAVDGYGRLVRYGADHGIGVIIENHGGRASDADFLVALMKAVDHPNAGILPDFGNFCIRRGQAEAGSLFGACAEEYDKYKGVEMLMPYAKGLSAKSTRFDEAGNEAGTDFKRMLQIAKDAGFSGYVGIEYEGGFMAMRDPEGFLSNDDGVKATKALLERVGTELL